MSTGPKRIVRRTRRSPAARTRRGGGRTYFVHIPKTAGVTVKAYLEDQYPSGQAFEMGEREALDVPGRTLNRHRLWTGHFGSEVLDRIAPAPDLLMTVVREPVARLRSWAAHGRRSRHPEYRAYLDTHTDLEALKGKERQDAFQCYWLARALQDGADSKRVPDLAEVPDLLERLDLVGVSEHLDRFLQLVSFRMGWRPPPLGWWLNRRPDDPPAQAADDEAEIRERLAVDLDLYARAETRFWQDYADMLNTLRPSTVAMTPVTAAAVSIFTVQDWLRAHHANLLRQGQGPASTEIALEADEPFVGSGWWWRESTGAAAHRWSGPTTTASVSLPPLVPGTYDLRVDLMGAVDWETWDGLTASVNGKEVFVVRERFGPVEDGCVTLRLHATLSPEIIKAQPGRTELALTVPECKRRQSLGLMEQSKDTLAEDTREVGVALHAIHVTRVADQVVPRLGMVVRRACA